MGATFKIITSRVGEGGQTHGIEVKRIQQLLKLADSDPGPITGEWNPKTKKALMDFQASLQWGPVNAYIEREDPYLRLFTLAYTAGVLLDLPNKLRSKSAALAFYHTCRERDIVYGWKHNGTVYNGGTRTIWGFHGYPDYAVAAVGTDIAAAEFDLDIPLSLNCTSFANLMLSIWSTGNAHGGHYDRSQAVGGFNPLALRYGMQPAPGSYVLKNRGSSPASISSRKRLTQVPSTTSGSAIARVPSPTTWSCSTESFMKQTSERRRSSLRVLTRSGMNSRKGII